MKTLELKDIAGYLPYGLNISLDGSINEAVAAKQSDTGLRFAINYEGEPYFLRKGFKPILRPVSDLYKPIIHNGKEIIPIVECAKIHDDKTDWTCDSGECALSLAYNKKEPQIWFNFSQNGFHTGFDSFGADFVNNQFQLFDYLHELKIDCHGLIESGLAIDCNTLEYNHYK